MFSYPPLQLWLSGFSACPHILQCASCGQQGTCCQSKQVPSLLTLTLVVFFWLQSCQWFGDRNTHSALCDSSSKSCLLFQKPFEMLPQNTFIKEGNICNDHEVITGHVFKSLGLEKYSLKKEKGWFVSFVLTAKFWAREGFWRENGLSPSSSDHLKQIFTFQTCTSGLHYTLFQLLFHLLALTQSRRPNLLLLELINMTAIAHKG